MQLMLFESGWRCWQQLPGKVASKITHAALELERRHDKGKVTSCKAAIKLGDCMYSMIAHCITDLTDVGPYAAFNLCTLAAASEADVSAEAC